MKKTNLQKGITLIALIITIVVLLILSVVAISAVKGEGIIEYAKRASKETNIAQIKENIQLDVMSEIMGNQGTITEGRLNKLIAKYNAKIQRVDGEKVIVIDDEEIAIVNTIANIEPQLCRLPQYSAELKIDSSTGKAIYISKGVEYAGIRFFGEYTMKVDESDSEAHLIVLEDGTTKKLKERGFILGKKGYTEKELILENKGKEGFTIVVQPSTSNFNNLWGYEEYNDGTYRIVFSLYLSGYTKARINDEITYRTYIILEDGSVHYSDVQSASPLSVYNEMRTRPEYENLEWFS